MRMLPLFAALVGMVVVVGGCASTTGPDPADLEGTWVVESFGAAEGLTDADPAVTSVITLKADEATGSGGVNSFSGSYQASDDGSISFGPLAATKMAGEPAAMEQESAFFAALEAARSFEFNEGKLVFGDMGNNTLVVLVPQ
jgi:heat shock protein HslJ